MLDQAAGIVKRVLAKRTILATGGLGQILPEHHQPARLARRRAGDGLSRRRARHQLEFVQFHPTTFVKLGAPRFLITEAVRGDGGRLVHADGTPFMQNYDAEWKDLAPRDVVSRTIYFEMLSKDVPNVYLDLRDLHQAGAHPRALPQHLCAVSGIRRGHHTELVPVVPAAHYFCGGVWVDEWGAPRSIICMPSAK